MIAKYRSVRPSKTVRLDLFASENKKLETDTKGVLENLKTAKLTQIRKQSSAARQVHFVVSRFWLFYKTRGYNRGTRNRAFTPKSVKCATFRANCATLNVVNSRTDTCNNNNVRLLLWISRYWSTCKKSAARPFIFSSCRNGCPLVWTKKPRGRVIKKFVTDEGFVSFTALDMPCRKDQFALLYFSTSLIVLIQVYNWEIRHHSLVCCYGFADILNILQASSTLKFAGNDLLTKDTHHAWGI